MAGQRPKTDGNWPMTSPYLQHWVSILIAIYLGKNTLKLQTPKSAKVFFGHS